MPRPERITSAPLNYVAYELDISCVFPSSIIPRDSSSPLEARSFRVSPGAEKLAQRTRALILEHPSSYLQGVEGVLAGREVYPAAACSEVGAGGAVHHSVHAGELVRGGVPHGRGGYCKLVVVVQR